MRTGSREVEIVVEYEDGRVERAHAAQWSLLRADGVQKVYAGAAGRMTSFAGHSIYWFYPEGENYIIGGGSVRYSSSALQEIIIAPDGTQSEREIDFMPDLTHDQIKLGWWKRG